jgi:hypothetical protein
MFGAVLRKSASKGGILVPKTKRAKACDITKKVKDAEMWKDIDGFDGAYQVSSLGRVKRIYKTRECKILMPWLTNNGYLQIGFGSRRRSSVHRLVAEAFCEMEPGCTIVNHINGIKTDNRADNLEWVTASKNNKHSFYVLGNKARNSKPVECIETGEVFVSISEAARQKNTNSGIISNCCNGTHKSKTAGGFHWRFYVQE